MDKTNSLSMRGVRCDTLVSPVGMPPPYSQRLAQRITPHRTYTNSVPLGLFFKKFSEHEFAKVRLISCNECKLVRGVIYYVIYEASS